MTTVVTVLAVWVGGCVVVLLVALVPAWLRNRVDGLLVRQWGDEFEREWLEWVQRLPEAHR